MSEPIVFCKGGGCTAKLGPGVLERVLSRLPKGEPDPALLVGFDSRDDGAVYRVSDDLAVIQTLDFFPPMVEDPYLFGQIAAANALSDVYAMGGEVKTALNIVCFPEKMDLNVLGRILQGGAEKVAEAGGSLVGGHSIADDGVKYGLSVMGFVDPKRILTNVGAAPGDRLILTKKLGVGLVCTAARVGQASALDLEEAVTSMTTLKRPGCCGGTPSMPAPMSPGLGCLATSTRCWPDRVPPCCPGSAFPGYTGRWTMLPTSCSPPPPSATATISRAMWRLTGCPLRRKSCSLTPRPPAACWPRCPSWRRRRWWPSCGPRAFPRPPSARLWKDTMRRS